ncbi:MAG: hypothetical protein A3F67_03160 [Verrucomicrobia bacterium RIFCSPHIGHO2_12_FULL_41_10]|nr:MAG: hypothetical protein A3F67_03160 [Verrucomicrobia bacterium RIFCSPHIGHO2_12_FULL_41_10]HLB32884.1 MFS transporter [Chthoniobacterales bacterium]
MPKKNKNPFLKWGNFRTKSNYRWMVVGMLLMPCFLNYADRQVIFSVFPVLEKEFGFSKLQLGMIGSSFMWVYAAGAFLSGFLSDRWPRKSLIVGGCFFWSLVTACTGGCSKLWQFVVVRALEGVGEVFYFPASNSLIADYHGLGTRSTALSLHQSGVYAGTIVGSWLGAWIAEYYGWRYGFYFLGGLGIVVAVFLGRFLHEPHHHQGVLKETFTSRKHSVNPSVECASTNRQSVFKCASSSTSLLPSSISNLPSPAVVAVSPVSIQPVGRIVALGVLEVFLILMKQPTVILLMMAFTAATFVTGIFLTWMPTFLYEKFSMNLASAGFASVMTIQTASVVSVLFTGWSVDRLIPKIPHARVLVQMVSLLLGIGSIVAVGYVAHLGTLIVAMVFFGFCKGGYDSGLYASLYDYVEPSLRGAAAGLMVTFGWSGGALGALVIGAVSSHGVGSSMDRMSHAIIWSASVYAMAAFLLMGVLLIKVDVQIPFLRRKNLN